MNAEVQSRFIPWLKGLPRHWTVRRAKYLFTQAQLAPKDTDGIVTAFRDGQVTLRENRRTDGFMLADQEVGYQGVRRGQLVIHSMDAFAGAIGISDSDGKCTPEYVVLQPCMPGLDPRFFAAALREMARQRFIEVSCPSVRERAPRIRYATFGEMFLPLPPPEEQQAIAAFLDCKTRMLDAVVRKKQQQVALLTEKRQAAVAELVSRGTKPGVPLKDSGIPSVGRIPRHWDVLDLRRRWTVVDCKHKTPEYVTEGLPLVSTTEVKPGRLDLTRVTRFVSDDDFAEMTDGRLPRRGDIIYSRNASLGAAAYVDTEEPFCMGQDVVLITSRRESQLFLQYQLNSTVVGNQIQRDSIGSTFKRINVEQILALKVIVPPPEEQRTIADVLDRDTAALDHLLDMTARSIDELREYRQALITAAVTGQLDVAAQEAA